MVNRRTLIAACLLGSTLITGTAAQTLHIGLTADPDTLDPTLGHAFPGWIVRAALCDKLVDNGEKLEIAELAGQPPQRRRRMRDPAIFPHLASPALQRLTRQKVQPLQGLSPCSGATVAIAGAGCRSDDVGEPRAKSRPVMPLGERRSGSRYRVRARGHCDRLRGLRSK